jgi:hypothetical protein
VQLVDRYFAAGMERLVENNNHVEPVSAQLLEVLDDAAGKQAVTELVKQWASLNKLQARYEQYLTKHSGEKAVDLKNKAQHQLREGFDPFFTALHEGLRQLDKTVRQHEKRQAEQAQADGKRPATDRKTKALKNALEELHKETKNAEIFYQHIRWLQERFPRAEYGNVTGLCKLARPSDVKEQEYSLNPGRYVGVVIEEDGKTEEEFIEQILQPERRPRAAKSRSSSFGEHHRQECPNPGGRAMTKWASKRIKELGPVITGKTPPKNEPHYFDGEELFVSPKDLEWDDQLFVTETETRVSRKALDKFRNQVIPKNSIMFTSLSFGFGKMGIASCASLTNQQINSVLVNKENDFRFVYYLLKVCTPFIFAYNSGIDTPIVPKSVFERIELRCPEVGVQKKIAAVLWAYDKMIENNERRIALLEQLAEEIYREWFVRLRFPG